MFSRGVGAEARLQADRKCMIRGQWGWGNLVCCHMGRASEGQTESVVQKKAKKIKNKKKRQQKKLTKYWEKQKEKKKKKKSPNYPKKKISVVFKEENTHKHASLNDFHVSFCFFKKDGLVCRFRPLSLQSCRVSKKGKESSVFKVGNGNLAFLKRWFRIFGYLARVFHDMIRSGVGLKHI